METLISMSQPLKFNKFDTQVLAASCYQFNRLHVAIVQGYYELNVRQFDGHTMLQIDSIYTIEESSKGKFNKRRIQQLYDIQFLLIPEDAAKYIRPRWQNSQKKSALVVSFKDKTYDSTKYKSGLKNVSALLMIPDNVIYISNNVHEAVYYRSKNAQPARYRIPDLDVLKLIRHSDSVSVTDIDQLGHADVEKQTIRESTRDDGTVDKCHSIRRVANFPKRNDKKPSGIMIFDELLNIAIRPVMSDGGGPSEEFYSRGPYDYEFQALYRLSNPRL